MPITLDELARTLSAAAVHAGACVVSGAATLDTAGPGDVTLVDSSDKLPLLAKSRAGAAIVPEGTGPLDRPSIEVADVHAAFTAARSSHFLPQQAWVLAP
jgi:UDP-3-O-[3-hydroxymyristoyl] glucosamine N-acyltransferase